MRSCPLRRSWTTRSSSWSIMSRPGAGYAPENPSGSRCLLDSNSTRPSHMSPSIMVRAYQVGSARLTLRITTDGNKITRPNREPEAGLKILVSAVQSRPSPPFFSRAPNRALRARGARLARTVLEVTRFGRLILVNRMTSAAEARAVVRDCSAPLEHGRVHDGVAPLTLRSPPSRARDETPRRNLGTLGRFVPSPPGRAILPPPSAARGRLA
jgi:hypothetical protein